MRMRKLGNSGLFVSELCFGAMTFGGTDGIWGQVGKLGQNEADALVQTALNAGINFFDTANVYADGRSETMLGKSLQNLSVPRDEVVIATKVAAAMGKGPNMQGTSRRHILSECRASLRRLNLDYIDLYQVHWPDRPVPSFGVRGLSALADRPDTVPIEETLDALADLVKAGKIRHVGVSNETPWGVSEYLRLARDQGLPRIASIQNAYNLLNRVFEIGLSEFALREDVGLLAYSPLAGGNLTGKYLGGVIAPGTRRDVARQFVRYDLPGQAPAAARYVAIAHAHGLDPAQLALAYVNSRPFVTATIIGATSLDQLRADIDSVNLTLSADAIAAIEAVHRDLPDPCP